MRDATATRSSHPLLKVNGYGLSPSLSSRSPSSWSHHQCRLRPHRGPTIRATAISIPPPQHPLATATIPQHPHRQHHCRHVLSILSITVLSTVTISIPSSSASLTTATISIFSLTLSLASSAPPSPPPPSSQHVPTGPPNLHLPGTRPTQTWTQDAARGLLPPRGSPDLREHSPPRQPSLTCSSVFTVPSLTACLLSTLFPLSQSREKTQDREGCTTDRGCSIKMFE